MLTALVDSALHFRLLVIMLVLVLAGLGWRATHMVPVDAFPDVTPVQVDVLVDAPGMAAEDIDQRVTPVVESVVAGLPRVTDVRSISSFGTSIVSSYFEEGTDIYFARQVVAERLGALSELLPSGTQPPELGPNTSGLGQVFWYTLEPATPEAAQRISDTELRSLNDWVVRPILRTAPGVDDIISWGGRERQIEVRLDPLALVKYDLTWQDVIDAIQANNVQAGGQYINIGPEQFLVRGLALIERIEDLERIVVKVADGTPVYVRDVAKIVDGSAPPVGAATRDGRSVALGLVLARTGENAKRVVEAVQARLPAAKAALPADVRLEPIYTRTEIVAQTMATATSALIEGALLVAIVLYLFLGELRSALVVIVTLPLAMLGAYIAMGEFGLSANLMSLAGLAIGIGMMVDGAVVVVESAFRALASRNDGDAVDVTAAVRAATHEVARPVTFAIAIIIVVFLPLFSLEGLEGKLFKPMAFAICFAMGASLLLSLTVVPVFCTLMLRSRRERDSFTVAAIKRRFVPLLESALHHKRLVAGSALGMLLATLAIFPLLGREFMPQLREGAIMWRVTSIPSTSLDTSIGISAKLAQAFKQFPEVQTTVAFIGPAEKGEPSGPNNLEIYTALKPPKEWNSGRSLDELRTEMAETLEKVLPNTVTSFTQPIQMRVEELISGVRATLALKVYGDDLAQLDRTAAQLRDTLANVPGVAGLSVDSSIGKPQIRVRVDREALARYGLSADDVLAVVRHGIGAEPIATMQDGGKRVDIAVRLNEASKASVEAIGQIPVRAANGAIVPLATLARIELAEGYGFIRRESLQHYTVLQMDVQGRDVDGFVKEADAAIAKFVTLPQGYRIEWGGAFENQQRALARLAVIVPLTILLIFVLLYTAFDSVRYAALVIANVPFAFIGGLLALLVTRQYVSVPSVIGFITLFGVAMLNGIVLVSSINQLREQGLPVSEAVRRGASVRLRPVLMTASVAILGLLPMLLSTGAGAETQRPLATVVVGGLLTATLLTLILLPVAYEWIETRGDRAAGTPSDATSPDERI